jgi:hypothetical protein
MANPKFLGCNLSLATYTWSAGVNTSYPVSNLKNGFPDIYSKSNATTLSQYITIDFGSAVAIDMGIVDGTNFASVGADNGIKLQYNTNDDANWADAVTVGTFTASNSVQSLAFATQTKRYWRILFDSTGALTAEPYIGNLFLGTSLNFEKTQQWGCVVQMPVHNVSTSEALDGRIRSAVTALGRYIWEMDFKLQSDAFVTAWRTFLSTVKNNGVPFYYIDSNSAIWCVVLDSNYNPTTMFRYNLNDTARLKIKTILAIY